VKVPRVARSRKLEHQKVTLSKGIELLPLKRAVPSARAYFGVWAHVLFLGSSNARPATWSPIRIPRHSKRRPTRSLWPWIFAT